MFAVCKCKPLHDMHRSKCLGKQVSPRELRANRSTRLLAQRPRLNLPCTFEVNHPTHDEHQEPTAFRYGGLDILSTNKSTAL